MATREFRDPVVRLAFSRRLRALRRAYGASLGQPYYEQWAFAAALGLHTASYSRYERAETEPSLGVLAALRRLTGVSLDHMIAGLEPGRDDLVPTHGIREDEMSLGARLQLLREIVEPDIAKCAKVMGVTVETWIAWETSVCQPPVEKVEEFAHRFGASMDFLYRGLLAGMPARTLATLMRLYPELEDAMPAGALHQHRANRTSTGRARSSKGSFLPAQK